MKRIVFFLLLGISFVCANAQQFLIDKEVGVDDGLDYFIIDNLDPSSSYIQVDIYCSGFGVGEAQVNLSFTKYGGGIVEVEVYASEQYGDGQFVKTAFIPLTEFLPDTFKCRAMVQSSPGGHAYAQVKISIWTNYRELW